MIEMQTTSATKAQKRQSSAPQLDNATAGALTVHIAHQTASHIPAFNLSQP